MPYLLGSFQLVVVPQTRVLLSSPQNLHLT